VELYLEGLPGVVEERTDVCSEARDSVRAPGEEERDEEEPGEEAEVLAGGDVVGRVVEVGAVKDSPKTKARAKQRGREEGRGSPWRRRRSSRAKPKAGQPGPQQWRRMVARAVLVAAGQGRPPLRPRRVLQFFSSGDYCIGAI
jgi:hypothetical protein